MSNTKDKILDLVKAFFRSISWKKVLTFSFFVVLSTIFWVIQVYRQKFEATLTIPIKYANVPDSIVFENELPLEISARIKDDGATLFKYYLLKRDDSLEINIRDIIKESTKRVIQGSSFEQIIRTKLYPSSELISYTPAHISYVYAILQQKSLPVIYDGYIDLPSGYMIDGELSYTPDSVVVYGSSSSLDTLYFAHTVTDTISDIISDTTFSVGMRKTKGIKFVPNSIAVSVPVDQFTSKEVDVHVTCVNLPSNMSIKFFPSTVKIPMLVGLKRYKDIDATCFIVKVDYNDIKDQKESVTPVRIFESPDYVRTKMPVPSEVEFILEEE